ncbi:MULTISPECIES: hypothetical protein [Bacillus cereus group]|uniref:hypothetical protein n=1 Tax=Bacillus cereus group TaxID=86661 RepID=UPI00202CCBA8|nr:hypothetical protein [Bacillus cereus group sp. BfR-BA-00999]MCM0006174.1 hypothetical protein [Bacillus paranthracis]MDX5884970.1 hypothetical protein [Bacillus cereus group sp. BfR-BA-00999]
MEMKKIDGKIVVGHLYKKTRRDGNFYGVCKDSEDKYRVGEYDKNDKGIPYFIFEGQFDSLLVAMAVCRMLSDAYEDGYEQGQLDCH